MKKLIIINSLTFASILNGADSEFKAQQAAKARSALSSTCQTLEIENSRADKQQTLSPKTEQQKLEDGCKILFECTGSYYAGNGLPKQLQNIVYEYLLVKQFKHKQTFIDPNCDSSFRKGLKSYINEEGKHCIVSLDLFSRSTIFNFTDNSFIPILAECFTTIHDAHGNKLLIVATNKRGRSVLQIWNWSGNGLIQEFESDEGFITCLATTTDSKGRPLLVSGTCYGSISIWDITQLKCIKKLHERGMSIRALTIVTDLNGKKMLAAIGDYSDRHIRIWDLESGLLIEKFYIHFDYVRLQGLTTFDAYDKELLVCGARDGKIRVWDPMGWKCIKTLEDTSSAVECITTFTDEDGNHLIAAGYSNNTIRIWDILSGVCVQKLSGPDGPIDYLTALTMKDKPVLFSASRDKNLPNTLHMWGYGFGDLEEALADPKPSQKRHCTIL